MILTHKHEHPMIGKRVDYSLDDNDTITGEVVAVSTGHMLMDVETGEKHDAERLLISPDDGDTVWSESMRANDAEE